MDFKLFLPLASTLVVGGTFTVFYMGYLKNKEIRERKPNIRIPNIVFQNDSSETKTDEKSEEEGEQTQVETKVEPKGSENQVPKTSVSAPTTTTVSSTPSS